MSDPDFSPALSRIILLAITAAAAIMMVRWGLLPVYGYDEAWHTYQSSIGPTWKNFLAMSADLHPALYYILLRPFTLLGADPFYPRLLSIIPSVLTLPLWFALLRKLRIGTVVALVATFALAAAYTFNSIGIMVRSYSFTVFLLLGALWFWLDLIPGTTGRPSRRSTIISLALFSAAFWSLYAAAFVTAAIFGSTLLLIMLDGTTRARLLGDWRRYTGPFEWVLFIGAHLAGVFWYWLGWGRNVNTDTPNHVAQFALGDDQPLLEFLHHGLRNEINLFTPLTDLPTVYLDAGVVVLLLTIATLATVYLRQRAMPLFMLVMVPLLLMAVLALLGILNIYPFGGHLRHQYILFPFLLMLVPLAMHAVWQALPNTISRSVLIILVLIVAVGTPIRSHQQRGYVGDTHGTRIYGEELDLLFSRPSEHPIFIPAAAFYPTYVHRLRDKVWYHSSFNSRRQGAYTAPQGWVALALPWAAFQAFGAETPGGDEVFFVKDQYRWLFDAVPDDLFFAHVSGVVREMGASGARVFAPQDDASIELDSDALRTVAATNGFILRDIQPLAKGAIWTIEFAADTAIAAAAPASTSTTAPSPASDTDQP